MKAIGLTTHGIAVEASAPDGDRALSISDRGGIDASIVPDFSSVYDRWFREVMRWARALGVPDAELEDVAQDVFLVVRRKLAEFDGRHLPAWLYRITQRTVSDYRRRSWFKNFFSRRSSDGLETMTDDGGTPEEILRRKQNRQQLAAILGTLSAKRRVAFVLFELEGYTCEEIASLEQTSVSSVWTRIHHARKDFVDRLAKLDRKGALR